MPYVAAGKSGTTIALTSPEGVNWTKLDTPCESGTSEPHVILADGITVVIGGYLWDTADAAQDNPLGLIYSTDAGVTWAVADSALRSGDAESWTYAGGGAVGNGRFVVAGFVEVPTTKIGGNGRILSCSVSDPSVWETATTALDDALISAVDFIDGMFVAVGGVLVAEFFLTPTVITSPDGITWTTLPTAPGSTETGFFLPTQIASDGTTWVAAGYGGDVSISSPDQGGTWQAGEYAEGDFGYVTHLHHNGSLWVGGRAAHTGGGPMLFRSNDGVAFTGSASPFDASPGDNRTVPFTTAADWEAYSDVATTITAHNGAISVVRDSTEAVTQSVRTIPFAVTAGESVAFKSRWSNVIPWDWSGSLPLFHSALEFYDGDGTVVETDPGNDLYGSGAFLATATAPDGAVTGRGVIHHDAMTPMETGTGIKIEMAYVTIGATFASQILNLHWDGEIWWASGHNYTHDPDTAPDHTIATSVDGQEWNSVLNLFNAETDVSAFAVGVRRVEYVVPTVPALQIGQSTVKLAPTGTRGIRVPSSGVVILTTPGGGGGEE
jgi:hypothetical protein